MSKLTGITQRHSRSCTRPASGCDCPWRAEVYDRHSGRKIRKTFTRLSEAKSWRHDAASGLRKGTMRAPTSTTLKAAAEAWLEAVERGEVLSRNRQPFKPSTIRGYRHDLETYVLRDLGARKLGDIRPDDLQALIDRLVGSRLSGSKVRNVLVPLQSLYRRHRREVPVDPTDGLDLPAPGGRRERAASAPEALALIEALPTDLQALFATAALGGLRRGEVRALRVSDVNYPAVTTIRVERGYDDVEGEIEPKSQKGRRVVPVAAELRRYLLAHKLATGRDGDELLFGRTARAPFTPTHVRKRAREAWAVVAVGAFLRGESLNLEPIGLHECRHTFVSLMHAAGCSLEEIGDFVGHSSTYMVDRYRHLLDGQRERAAERLDAFLAGPQTGPQSRKPALLSGRE
jgi:integrase